jgi:hypothetical protein
MSQPSTPSPELQALQKVVTQEASVLSQLSDQLKTVAGGADPDGNVPASELKAIAMKLSDSSHSLSSAVAMNKAATAQPSKAPIAAPPPSGSTPPGGSGGSTPPKTQGR